MKRTTFPSRLSTYTRFVILAFLVASCGTATPSLLMSQIESEIPQEVNFQEIAYYVKRAKSAYDTEDQIKDDYPNLVHVETLEAVDVLYFVENDTAERYQTISVRGTAGRSNVLEDLKIALAPDEILGVRIHRGFQEDALAVYNDAIPYLDKDIPIRLTGHSLGAAVAVILAAYLDADGYEINRIVTFGQPKYSTDPLKPEVIDVTTRVVNGPDVVPTVPPFSIFGRYAHFAEEVVLFEDDDFVLLDLHDANRLSIGVFWRNLNRLSLENHHIGSYAANINQKAENP